MNRGERKKRGKRGRVEVAHGPIDSPPLLYHCPHSLSRKKRKILGGEIGENERKRGK